jgi:hydrogenase large subunit
MEVGPLARVLVGYASGREDFKEIGRQHPTKLNVPAAALFSTLGRTAARGLESIRCGRLGALSFMIKLIGNIRNGDTRMADMDKFDPAKWPAKAQGVGIPKRRAAHSATGS